MERELLGAADHVLYVSRSLLAEENAMSGARRTSLTTESTSTTFVATRRQSCPRT